MDRKAISFVASMVREAVLSLDSARLGLEWAATSEPDRELVRALRQAAAEALQLAIQAEKKAARLERVVSVQALATAQVQASLREAGDED